MRLRLYLSATAVFLCVGCSTTSDGGLTSAGIAIAGPSALQGADTTAVRGSPPDLGGAWDWNSVESLRMPRFVAALVGVEPEGENTHARCESAGTMTIVQTGSRFSGSAARTSNTCVTTGGQAFQQPGVMFQVADGRIRGGSAHFSFESPTVAPCPHTVTITSDSQGVARSLSGTGHCVLPGHPQSESPIALDPPPGGTSVTLRWDAVRP